MSPCFFSGRYVDRAGGNPWEMTGSSRSICPGGKPCYTELKDRDVNAKFQFHSLLSKLMLSAGQWNVDLAVHF